LGEGWRLPANPGNRTRYGLQSVSGPVQRVVMKRYLKLFPVLTLLFAFASFAVCHARAEEKWERPGTQEQAAVDQANKELDRVYAALMAKSGDPKNRAGDLDAEREKTSLRDAQRAWIKWRDAEAMFIARHGGAVGGSALRMDVADAQLKLINERLAVLKAYLTSAQRM
jgi:uncharacterized protein YecT (DUF1311 family)